MKERELFLPVKSMLEEIGYEKVYGEVGNLDVLALKGPVNTGVEMKTRVTFYLIEQAIDRLRYVDYMYIAVPFRKSGIPRVAREVLNKHGIGIILVDHNRASIVKPARINRISGKLKQRKPVYFNIRNQIRPYHEYTVGGVRSGEAETDYSYTIKRIQRFLRFHNEGQGATVDEILNHCETHYANPKPSLVATLQQEWNEDWCEIFIKDGKRYYKLKAGR